MELYIHKHIYEMACSMQVKTKCFVTLFIQLCCCENEIVSSEDATSQERSLFHGKITAT